MAVPYRALVRWLDAVKTEESVTGAEDIGSDRETLGWVLANTEYGIIVAMTRDKADGAVTYGRAFLIPKAMVTKVTRL